MGLPFGTNNVKLSAEGVAQPECEELLLWNSNFELALEAE